MPILKMVATVLGLGLILPGSTVWSQAAPSDGLCGGKTEPAFCRAVRGARAEGWPAQSRSEVMAQHGMVVTSQPLAAQAGLQIFMGHSVTSIDGGSVGGVQIIMFVPGPNDSNSDSASHGGNGYYRAASDFRKDGEAVGW